MTSKPLIIVLSTGFAPHVGGAEVAVQELLVRLRDRFDFVVVTARMDVRLPVRDRWNGIPVVRVGWGSALDKTWLLVAGPWQVWRLRPQALWAVMASYAGAASWIAERLLGVPYALMLQEGDDLSALERRLGVLRAPFKWIFRDATAVHAIAPFLGDWARDHGARAAVIVIPNGVDVAAFKISDAERTAGRLHVRHELNIPPDADVVLTISRLVIKNGIADLISAVKHIPTAHLIVVGDGELRDPLAVQAAEVRDRIHFVGTQPPAEIKKYAAASDIFCRPSLSEGLGIVFLEAMAMGLPVVATRVGGIPSIVSDGKTGLLVAPHAPEELATALVRVLHDSALRQQLILNGFSHVQNFEWHRLAPRFSEWLAQALEPV